jgi:hypothetical protein
MTKLDTLEKLAKQAQFIAFVTINSESECFEEVNNWAPDTILKLVAVCRAAIRQEEYDALPVLREALAALESEGS